MNSYTLQAKRRAVEVIAAREVDLRAAHRADGEGAAELAMWLRDKRQRLELAIEREESGIQPDPRQGSLF